MNMIKKPDPNCRRKKNTQKEDYGQDALLTKMTKEEGEYSTKKIASVGDRCFQEGLSSGGGHGMHCTYTVHIHGYFRVHASQGTNARSAASLLPFLGIPFWGETSSIYPFQGRTSRKNLAARTLHEHGLPTTVLRLIDEFCESDVGTVAHAPIEVVDELLRSRRRRASSRRGPTQRMTLLPKQSLAPVCRPREIASRLLITRTKH